MFVACAKRGPSGSRVYTVGGDTTDVAGFVAALDALLPGAAARISIKQGSIPIASKIDDSALRADVPGLLRIPLAQGIRETLEVFTRLHAEGRLPPA